MNRERTDRAGVQLGTDDAGTPRTSIVLWSLLGSALAWTFHLLASYVAIAWTCTTGRLDATRPLLLVISLVALIGIASSGWLARKHWHIARHVDKPEEDSWDSRMGERTARVSFLMVSGLFLAVLFAIAVLYETSTIAVAPMCEPGVSA
jgi:hypothetical protein